jgi:hypothetical protein
MHRTSALLLVSGVLGLACGLPTDGCGCPPTPAVAVVYGRVTTTAGDPVPDALVFAYIALEGSCGRRESPDGLDRTRTDGSYSVGVASGTELDTACVLVRVQAPAALGLVDRPDTSVILSFRYALPYDSVRVDASLALRPGGP